MRPVPLPMTRFQLLQFGALFLRQIRGHLSMRLDKRFMHAPARFHSYLLKLTGRFIDDGRYLGELFRR